MRRASFPLYLVRRLPPVLSAFLLGFAQPPAGAATIAIDTTPALTIGPQAVSRYLVDKYYARFAAGIRRAAGRAPSPAESADWFATFVARQTIIAHLASQGYLERSEVRDVVDRMERYMLTQPEGPFYRKLYEEAPSGTESLEQLYRRSFRIYDLVVAHFVDADEALRSLGEDFTQQDAREQTRRILESRRHPDVEVHEGPTSWPFFPFVELTGPIETAPRGQWVRHREPDGSEWWTLVRAVTEEPVGNFAAARVDFAKSAERIRELKLRTRRRQRVLAAAQVRFDRVAVAALARFCASLPRDAVEIPPLPPALGSPALMCCRRREKSAAIDAETLRAHFNTSFLRQLPRTGFALRAYVEDMLLEDFDLREARATGVDATPQFQEDRRGFAGYQALDLFERETLVPSVAIGPAEIETYYREHRDEFQRATRIHARQLTFASLPAAAAWRWHRPGETPAEQPQIVAELEIERDRPLAGFEDAQASILAAPPGATFGPFPQGDGAILLTKIGNAGQAPIPTTERNETIRRRLLRPRLDARERQLAAELARQLAVENHLDYARYGLPPATPALLSQQ